MNYKHYKIKGKHVETKRVRTVKIDAINEDDAIKEAHSHNLETVDSVEILPFEPPTERQLEYATSLNIELPEGVCKQDVSALISRSVDRDGIPNEGLIDFATNRKLFFSKYIGKTALYNWVFYELPDLDRVAFFIFSIYRYISDNRHSNLDTHPHYEKFYEFANSIVGDERFMKSMNKYSGADLKFFGELTTPDGWTHTGGSVNTIAFKAAREFLIDNHLIADNAPYKNKRLYHTTTVRYHMTEEEVADAHAKGFKVEVVREITDENSLENGTTYSSKKSIGKNLRSLFSKLFK